MNNPRLQKIPCFYVSSFNLRNFNRGEPNDPKYQEKELLEFIQLKATPPKWYQFTELRHNFYPTLLKIVEIGKDLGESIYIYLNKL